MDEGHPFDRLRSLCARLRAPDGCPWDRAQTLESLTTYVIEETYEVVDSIEARDPGGLEGELGDLLFQVVLVAQLAAEQGWFDILDVCRRIEAKMIRRHPHVFGDVPVDSADQVVRNWERIKQEEDATRSALDGVPRQLPALLKALRITEKAAALGFDWERVEDVVAKLEEEVAELRASLAAGAPPSASEGVREELGDVLFVMANLARQLGIDPEAALQGANGKFVRRFSAMERRGRERGVGLSDLSLPELDELWEEAKREEALQTVAGAAREDDR